MYAFLYMYVYMHNTEFFTCIGITCAMDTYEICPSFSSFTITDDNQNLVSCWLYMYMYIQYSVSSVLQTLIVCDTLIKNRARTAYICRCSEVM